MWNIKFHPKVKKELLELDPRVRTRIIEVIKELQKFPDVTLDIKVLKGLSVHNYRFLRVRVGKYRIVFVPFWSERTLLILAIGPRGSVYKEIKRRVK